MYHKFRQLRLVLGIIALSLAVVVANAQMLRKDEISSLPVSILSIDGEKPEFGKELKVPVGSHEFRFWCQGVHSEHRQTLKLEVEEHKIITVVAGYSSDGGCGIVFIRDFGFCEYCSKFLLPKNQSINYAYRDDT